MRQHGTFAEGSDCFTMDAIRSQCYAQVQLRPFASVLLCSGRRRPLLLRACTRRARGGDDCCCVLDSMRPTRRLLPLCKPWTASSGHRMARCACVAQAPGPGRRGQCGRPSSSVYDLVLMCLASASLCSPGAKQRSGGASGDKAGSRDTPAGGRCCGATHGARYACVSVCVIVVVLAVGGWGGACGFWLSLPVN